MQPQGKCHILDINQKYFQVLFRQKIDTCNNFFRVPRTGYMKLIDIWQLASLTLPFAFVILHTLMENFKQKRLNGSLNNEAKYDRLLKFIRFSTTYGVTFAYILFIIGFFGMKYI